jgi:ribosomal-protein-alanine N-acetyltransferase
MYVFPVLFTERLKLRQLSVDDFPSLIQLANNKKISSRIINIPHPYQEFHAVHRLRYVVEGFKSKEKFVFAIVLKDVNVLIGEISLNQRPEENAYELGYWIGEPYWNQGYATEAIAKVIDFGFQRLTLHTIYATVDADNEPSAKVLVKNGFKSNCKKGNVFIYVVKQTDHSSKF